MTHPFGSPRVLNPYSSAPEFESPSHFGERRVFLVAIQGSVLAPHERNSMQRMRVVVLPANQPSELNPSDLLPGVYRQPLSPISPSLPMTQQKQLQPRPVRGEILRDPEGRLYEKIGERIRPLNKLVSGSRGQVLELVSSRKPVFKTRRSSEPDVTPLDPQKPERENPPGGARQREEFNQASVVQSPTQTPKPAPYRKLFLDPGQPRVIRLGDFKSMLVPQLAHPERVRDTHRLPC
jgi:hypothetical protein